MRIHYPAGLLMLALLAPTAAAQAPVEQALAITPAAPRSAAPSTARVMTVLPTSKVWVEGSSTVRRYRCEATRVDGTIRTSSAASSTAIAELQSAVRGVDLVIPVATMECGDNTMDGHMRRALKAQQHPSIRFQLTSHEVIAQNAERGSIRMTGRLNIAGQEQLIELDAEAVREGDDVVRVRGSKDLKMSDFGVRPPTLMLGTLKVHDPVVVRFEMLLGS